MQHVHEGNNIDGFFRERNTLAIKRTNWNVCPWPNQDVNACNFDVWPTQCDCLGNRAIACADVEHDGADRNLLGQVCCENSHSPTKDKGTVGSIQNFLCGN